MLSPTLSVPPTDGTSLPTPGTRRRGLSYLRSLSSHSHSSASGPADQPRTSPRSFFQRSTSYNSSDTKGKPSGRRRSASKPDEPTIAPADRERLTRITSAGNPPPAEDSSSGEDRRASRPRERTAENTEEMARSRPGSARRVTDTAGDTTATRPVATRTVSTNSPDESKQQLPMIRFYPHQDLRNGRQSLNFSPISRTLPIDDAVIRVGRYSEREGLPIANPSTPSDAPVGFKSKVVSRKHCEFSFSGGQWHIRDVASSSGTFLNHIRLSQPNQESKPFPIKDGDIVQLGIDFRGGEEMIFRCVKIRVECNRSWQKKPNTFNKTRRAQLLGLTKDQPAANNSGECSICLGSVLPCQALFVAPCAHVWHYKCIRPMLEGRQSQYPQFQCPNCRAYSDLEADVDLAEEDMDEWMENGADTDDHLDIDQTDRPRTAGGSEEATPEVPQQSDEEPPTVGQLTGSGLLARRAATNPTSPEISAVNGIDIPGRPDDIELQNDLEQQRTNTESPNAEQIIAGEGPLTPRNNAGPFVFDGSGGAGGRRLVVSGLPGVMEERL